MSSALREYYERLYPFEDVVRWLTYGGTEPLANRELSFTLDGGAWVRNVRVVDAAALRNECVRRAPVRIDIGAFTRPPPPPLSGAGVGAGAAAGGGWREVVFDVDLTDYDDVRTCCKGAEACACCWSIARDAVRLLDRRLRTELGFRHLLWVYSGRRGVHCWVADRQALALDDAARAALVAYLGPEPRLDAKVTRQTRHLLKAPFVVHPATGRVCVPFDAAAADSFSPDAVPTLAAVRADPGVLDPYLAFFRDSFAGPLARRALARGGGAG